MALTRCRCGTRLSRKATEYGFGASGDDGDSTAADCRLALADLSDGDRRLIVLLFWEGQTQSEVAARLGISQQAVSKRMHAILNKLPITPRPPEFA